MNDGEATIGVVLAVARQRLVDAGLEPADAAFDALELLAALCAVPRTRLLARRGDCLERAVRERYDSWIERRTAREPVAYITGQRGFWTLDLQVDERVLVPRPETELVVERCLAAIADLTAPRVVDIGTGSGAIALAIASERPDAEISATDISARALEVARANCMRAGFVAVSPARGRDETEPGETGSVGDTVASAAVRIRREEAHPATQTDASSRADEGSVRIAFLEGDCFEPLDPGVRFDAIVSNPPYVVSSLESSLQPEVRREPRLALFDDAPGGVGTLERIVRGAPAWLSRPGYLAVEIGYDQADAIRQCFEATGFRHVAVLRDLAGHPRVVEGWYRDPD